MEKLYDRLMKDYRLKEGLRACINCGCCTAVCPAAEFYKYDPREIVSIVQTRDDEQIEMLLKGDEIWYCGECMSCVTRCPRNNAPGLVIMALRNLSIETGFFMDSEKGRQMYCLCKDLCGNILNYGYCIYPRTFKYATHPEAGLVWKWEEQHMDDVYDRLGANLDKEGPGALRRIPQADRDELKKIFDITGCSKRLDMVYAAAKKKADELGLTEEEYYKKVNTECKGSHLNKQ